MKAVTIKKVMVKEFVTNGHAYAICKDNEGWFWGFDLSKLDKNGCLAQEYNGITGHRNKTMIETMRCCYQSARTYNEIDREKIKSNDKAELKKLLAIIEDSYIEIA